MNDYWLPPESNGEIVALDALEAMQVRSGIAHWQRLKGARRFPTRDEIKPRDLGALLSNIILARVLEGGADYEYRIVGDALVQGFNENFAGRKLSSIIADAPKFGLGLRMLYEMVRGSGEPLGYRGWVGQDMTGAQFVYHENAVLPFGPHPELVDHIMIVSIIIPRRQA